MNFVNCVKCGGEIDIHEYLKKTAGTQPPSCPSCQREVTFEASFSRPIWPADWYGHCYLDKYDRWIVEITCKGPVVREG